MSEDKRIIYIEAQCQALKDIGYPIFGFSIKNQTLQQLIGTNTARRNLILKPMKKGEKRKVSWQIPNILNDGEYYIDCTVAHDDASLVADRWPDAATLKIYREESNPYIIYSPDISFSDKLV